MGRSVRVAAIAAALLISLPAAAFADTGTVLPGTGVAAVDCSAPDAGPGGHTGSIGPAADPGRLGGPGQPGGGAGGTGKPTGDRGAGDDRTAAGPTGHAIDGPADCEPATDPADAVDPVDSTDPADAADPADPADAVDPADPADAVDPADPADAVDPADPVDPTEPADASSPDPAAPAEAYAGAATSAAAAHGWGEPDHVDEFDGELTGWNLYDGPGHAGEGTRSPDAASVENGILTIDGDADGTTAGMAWTGNSQKYGRWEGRVRAPESDPTYNALLLLWPTAEDFPVGGEIDFMEMTDHTRQTTELFLHYGEDNSQVQGEVEIDGTQWNNWAVEWTPDGVVAYVNGKEWWRTDDTSILPPGPMHLCIQLDWFPDGDGPVQPSTMEVDWVRQYSLPDPGTTGEDRSGEDPGGAAEHLPERLTEGGPDPVRGSATRAPSTG